MPAKQKPVLVLATTSRDKIKEIKKVLGASAFSYLSLSDFPLIKPAKENGKTFMENAVLKARRAAEKTGFAALADDSGICVNALGGNPGIHSSRWAGAHATDADRNTLLLKKLKNAPFKKRKAYYQCAIALAAPFSEESKKEKIYSVEAKCRGFIARAPSGKNGFGYDPIFYIPGYNCTMAQIPLRTKNKFSHRGKALIKMKKKLHEIFSRSY